MKTINKITAVAMAGVMSVSMMGAVKVQAAEGKNCTIGVAFYQDTGLAVDATKAYLESMADTLNVEFKYTVLTQTDEAVNLTKMQELISSGVDGIISTMDLGSVSIVQECEAAGVYLAGYLCDYETSFTSAYDQVFKNEYFLGTASDGPCGEEIVGGYDFFDSLIEYNERAQEPITHVSLALFPSWAFPSQQVMADQFMEKVEEYNKDAENPITVDPLNEETDVLQFAPLDSTYFAKHEGIQAIMGFAAGTAFIYPTMVAAGVDKDIKLFTSGYEGGETENFGSNGTGTFQQNTVCAVESINYPLVLLLNKINGVEFADQPQEAERRSVASIIVNSDEDMAKFESSLYATADVAAALYTGEDVLNMTAYANPDATYADLTETLNHMTIDDLR